MSLIMLQPLQISAMWENIKQSVMIAQQVPLEKQEAYGTKLLANLLSGKFQCWVVRNPAAEIVAIGVTTIVQDNMFETINLHILSLYGLRILTPDIADRSFKLFYDFAVRNNCEKIVMTTNVPRVIELATAQGFHDVAHMYEIVL